VKVRLLGPLAVLDDSGHALAIPGGRQRTLLALLALNPGRVTPADRLIDDLWGAAAPQQPGNALQIAVFKLRRALGADFIETRPPGYVLCLPAENVDAFRFEQLVREARAAVADGRAESAIDHFDEALEQWHGDALAEFSDVAPAMAAASRLEELKAVTIEERFDALLALGRDADLIPDLDAAITALPFRERLRGQLMLALYRSGRQADALRAYRDARQVLAEELGLEPGSELRRLEAAILGQDGALDRPAAMPPDKEPAGSRGGRAATLTNLRPALSSFVGREEDITGIGELLEDHRLVTLVGAGGCGKTRLATEFAGRQLDTFGDGVWFAALDTVAGGGSVTVAVAEAVGLSSADTAGQPALAATGVLERLQSMLGERTALVVLDNCEHVIDDAARLAVDLLASAPRLRIIATSREALRVPGEMVWRVPPLGTDEAVTLFTERARAAAATFAPSDTDRALVAELCGRVDGMPLAIELTAAHTTAFTIGQLAERLDDRFRLVTGGARTALPRHQTLRAVTDWSYDLLFDDERKVFERLAVFVGGCSLEAAEIVCSDDALSGEEIGGLVGRLVDKSLVVADGSGRFRLLFSLADYGRARLDDRGDGDSVRDRHAAHYAALCQGSYLDWRTAGGHDQAWWLAVLTSELDNIRAALDWSIARGDATTAQLIAGHIGWFWWNTGRAAEGHHSVERALACAGPTPAWVRAPAVTNAAWFGLEAGQVDAAARYAAEAIALCEQVADYTSLGIAWALSAQLALLEGRNDVAAACLDSAQQASESASEPWYKGVAAAARSWAGFLAGRTEAAEREAMTALAVLRSVGDICNLVWMLSTHSRRLQTSGRIEEAEAAVREAHDVCEAHSLRGWQVTMSARLGSLALQRGEYERGAELYRSAISLARELGLPAAEAVALDGLGVAHRRAGRLDEARRCHQGVQAIADRIGPTVTIVSSRAHEEGGAAYTSSQLGYVAEQTGDVDEASRRHGEALGLAEAQGDKVGIALALEGLAGVAAAASDGEQAARLLGRARQLRATAGSELHGDERIDVQRAERRARELLGDDGYDAIWSSRIPEVGTLDDQITH
jgi:predicted ATPase/DNA-binding SARP family transcriptional activator